MASRTLKHFSLYFQIKLQKFDALKLDEKGEKIRSEFYELIKRDEILNQNVERFKPSDEVFS